MGGPGSGGARDGAGRPAIDSEVRERISLTLSPRLIRHLKQSAEQKRVSVSQLVADILENKL